MNIDRVGSLARKRAEGCPDRFAVAAIPAPRWFSNSDTNPEPLEWPIV